MNTTPSVVTITTAGTPVQVWAAGPGATANPVPARSISLQNTADSGWMYVGTSTLNKSTLAGVIAKVEAGSVFTHEAQDGRNTIDTTQYWVDHDVSGSKALASYSQV